MRGIPNVREREIEYLKLSCLDLIRWPELETWNSALRKGLLLSDFFKWLIVGWSIVVVGIAALGTILVVKYGEVKKIETDDVSLCFIIVFFCWLIPIIAFTILARTLGF